jgi:hypothetical protein
MDVTVTKFTEKPDQLPREAAEVSVALDRGGRTNVGVPHYSVIGAQA